MQTSNLWKKARVQKMQKAIPSNWLLKQKFWQPSNICKIIFWWLKKNLMGRKACRKAKLPNNRVGYRSARPNSFVLSIFVESVQTRFWSVPHFWGGFGSPTLYCWFKGVGEENELLTEINGLDRVRNNPGCLSTTVKSCGDSRSKVMRRFWAIKGFMIVDKRRTQKSLVGVRRGRLGGEFL